MRSNEIRKRFLDFFRQYKHKIISSDSLIPSSDPSLLFTSAGMVQFKKYYLGKTPKHPRMASCQKCFRTSDIDQVGYTFRHLTFFEMLGNFSLGDYFKKETIQWGWEFLTKEMSLPEDKLYATIYQDDEEAYKIWKTILPESRIYRLGEETNFWAMGPAGPCGPCSEIIYDLGEKFGCKKNNCVPGCDCDRWLEIWNLVFTQFDRTIGQLNPLPKKNIDTGMGLERLTGVVNNLDTVFQTDLFLPIIDFCKELTGKSSGKNTAYHIISDHVRSITFLIGDGITPSNEGRGYVLRRLIRRAVRQGKILGQEKPFLYRLTGKVVELMQDTYPELVNKRENIAFLVKMEEGKFLETLETGLNLLDELINKTKKSGNKTVSGKEIFKLYDTYGFPSELSKEILKESGLTFNQEEFDCSQKEAVDLARQSWKGTGEMDITHYNELIEKIGKTEFVGYKNSEIDTKVTAILKDNQEIILQTTPFYGETGGQVGDTGKIIKKSGTGQQEATAEVVDTQRPIEDLIVHRVKLIKGKFEVGNQVIAKIDIERRQSIKRHHTVTHFLHKALRQVLGSHVTQSGSLVAPDRLRFDFSHLKKMTGQEISRVEDIVNENIVKCIPVKIIQTSLDEARSWGAMALFGEKYGEKVRCVMIGDDENNPSNAVSLELCGGTHINNTGEIGFLKIISESSIGSGLRRIEALAGKSAFNYIRENGFILNELSAKLRCSPAECVNKIDMIIQKQKQLEKQIESLQSSSVKPGQIVERTIKGIKLMVYKTENLAEKNLRSIADKVKSESKTNTIVVVLNTREDKMSFVITATKDIIQKKFDAAKLARKLAETISGSAGGRQDFAQGGGKKTDKPPDIFKILGSHLDI